MDLTTVFDGWGTELIGLLVTICFGGCGLWYYKRGKISQKQKAGNGSEQNQEVRNSDEKNVAQKQKAGDNSKQTQIG